MAIKIKAQKDYLRTEVSLDLPVNVAEIDEVLRTTETNGRLVILYNGGKHQGINIEQSTKMTDAQSTETRKLLGIADEKA